MLTVDLEKLRELVRAGYASGKLIPEPDVFVDGEFSEQCLGCALTAAYFADTGELPWSDNPPESPGDILKLWARKRLQMTDNEFSAFTNGFDSCVPTRANRPPEIEACIHLGYELRKEFVK